MYNSVYCVNNCTEAENESQHKKATATCYNLYSVAARAATIQLPQDTIGITIYALRYDTYHDTILTT